MFELPGRCDYMEFAEIVKALIPAIPLIIFCWYAFPELAELAGMNIIRWISLSCISVLVAMVVVFVLVLLGTMRR